MSRQLSQGLRFVPWLLLALVLLLVFPLGMLRGQDAMTLAPGSAVVGTIGADQSAVTYSFNGNAGDVVTLRAVAITPGADPNLTLAGPNQQPLAFNDNESYLPQATASALTFRLQQTGAHTAIVRGTPGDFVLTLAILPAADSTGLEADTPANIALPAANPAQVFEFNTDPFQATTLLLNVSPTAADVRIEVRNATGEVVAMLQNNVQNVCLNLGPGDEVHTVTVTSLPESTGTVTLTVSNAPCELGAVRADVPPVATTPFDPVPIEGVCAASGPNNINIRTEPTTQSGVVALLPSGQPIQVVGQNDGGSWYAVQGEFVQGWIAASVVFTTGPCDGLPILSTNATPTATPAPESTAETTPEMTREPTPEMTAEPTVEATEEATEEATP